MNLDALTFALSQISYSVTNLTKKNFKQTSAEINHVNMKLTRKLSTLYYIYNDTILLLLNPKLVCHAVGLYILVSKINQR